MSSLLPLGLRQDLFGRGLGLGHGLPPPETPDSLLPGNDLLTDGDLDLLKKIVPFYVREKNVGFVKWFHAGRK